MKEEGNGVKYMITCIIKDIAYEFQRGENSQAEWRWTNVKNTSNIYQLPTCLVEMIKKTQGSQKEPNLLLCTEEHAPMAYVYDDCTYKITFSWKQLI